MHTIAQAILIMMCGKEIKKAVTHNKHLLFYSRNYRSRTNDQAI
jgi:hypothetical protein